MTMTPLAPRAPYIAVADASFRISIDSMSAGAMAVAIELSVGNPSIIYKGALL